MSGARQPSLNSLLPIINTGMFPFRSITLSIQLRFSLPCPPSRIHSTFGISIRSANNRIGSMQRNFGKRKINEITTKDVIAWQNELLSYRDEKRKPYSQTYLKTLHNQLSAIFNHAVRFYDLHSNPAAKAGNMGTEERREMLFWTKEEYQKFAEEMMDKPVSYYAFQMLYWTGIREGELLALTPADFDFERGTVKISKTYQRLKGQDVITSPKTKKSNRTIQMPDFLCQEMQEFFKMQYGLKKKDRIFTVTKSYLHHEMDRGAKAAGVKRIRIHDLRHSHISLLII